MSGACAHVLAEAMKLSPGQRVELAEALLAASEASPDVEAAWVQEALRRLKDIRAGRVQPLSEAEMERRLAARRSA